MTKGIWLFLAFIASIALIAGFALAIPSGANWTDSSTTQTPNSDPQEHAAYAGNTTFLDLYADVASMSWQGYYGNVTGTIQLADGNDDVFYNWSVASPSGEVYASVNGTGVITWGNIACFDADNSTAVEALYNISGDDVDGLNETFSDSNTHNPFFTGSVSFAAGACPAAYMFDETKEGAAGTFEEVVLTDSADDTMVIFAALLEPTDETGFDGEYYDFEMLVLENGHGSGASSGTNYYFYVELEA